MPDGLVVPPNPLNSMSTLHSLPDDKVQTLAEPSKSGGVFYASRLADGYYGAEEVKRETLYLGSLDTIVDRLHELFDRWERQGTFPPVVRIEMLYRARLAAHEWIATWCSTPTSRTACRRSSSAFGSKRKSSVA